MAVGTCNKGSFQTEGYTYTVEHAVELSLDITEKIITTLWLSPLSTSHRATFIKSSHLVSKTWSAVFSRVAARDVHILSASHGVRFLNILFQCSISHTDLLDQLCRSITFEHEHKFLFPGPRKNEQLFGRVIHLILLQISTSPRLPRLCRVALVLKNFLMSTIFEDYPFLHMPFQVQELDIDFTYCTEAEFKAMKTMESRGFEKFYTIGRGTLPFIKRLRLKGVPRSIVEEFLTACESKECLMVLEQDAWE